MAPSLEEPVAEALEHSLKQKPELVAPEPGTPNALVLHYRYTDQILQSTVPDPNQNRLDRVTLAMAVPISPSVPLHPKVQTLTFPS